MMILPLHLPTLHETKPTQSFCIILCARITLNTKYVECCFGDFSTTHELANNLLIGCCAACVYVRNSNRNWALKIPVENDTEPFNVFYDHERDMAAINPPNKSIVFRFVIIQVLLWSCIR